MVRHGSWQVFDQTNLDDLPARIFAEFKVSTVCFLNLCCCLFHFGNIQGASRADRGSISRQPGSPGTSLCWSDFSRNRTIITNSLWNVSRDNFLRRSEQSMRNRRPVIFQPAIWKKNPDMQPQKLYVNFEISLRNAQSTCNVQLPTEKHSSLFRNIA